VVIKVDSDDSGALESFKSNENQDQHDCRSNDEFDLTSCILKLLGCKVSDVSREEAARELLDRPIKIVYRPVIVELEAPSKIFK
jgi:arsenate reductase-like glutaredoxin family protein